MPDDLRAFYSWSNGYDGYLKGIGQYISVYPTTALVAVNYPDLREEFPWLVVIGSNGALEAYALDFRNTAVGPSLVAIDSVAPDPDEFWPLGDSFTGALERLTEQRPSPDGY